MKMRHFKMQMHLNRSLIYTPATERVCREDTCHPAADELLLKVEYLCTQCCHLSAGLILVDAHFVLDVCSMVCVLQRVEHFHEVTVGWRHAQDHHSPTGNVKSLSLQISARLHKYKTIPIIQQTVGQNCRLHPRQYSKSKQIASTLDTLPMWRMES